MFHTLCKSKIHRATVTDASLDYEGSITIDRVLMDAADILAYERVQVVNLNNGARLETYVIEGERDSGTVCLNGAAAHHAAIGDKIIVISYGMYDEAEIGHCKPKIIFVDENNKPVERS